MSIVRNSINMKCGGNNGDPYIKCCSRETSELPEISQEIPFQILGSPKPAGRLGQGENACSAHLSATSSASLRVCLDLTGVRAEETLDPCEIDDPLLLGQRTIFIDSCWALERPETEMRDFTSNSAGMTRPSCAISPHRSNLTLEYLKLNATGVA